MKFIILAGGVGSRLAPFSTPESPKYTLPLDGPFPLLADAYNFAQLMDANPKDIVIVTDKKSVGLCSQTLAKHPGIDVSRVNIIGEEKPVGTLDAVRTGIKTLAPAPHDVIAVIPADAAFKDMWSFVKAARDARDLLLDLPLLHIMFGMKPTFANDQYGYVANCYGFVEKPDAEAAAKLINEGWLWNMGFSFFTGEGFEKNRLKHLLIPRGTPGSFDREYLQKIAPDKIRVIPFSPGAWDDLGSLKTLVKARNFHNLFHVAPKFGKYNGKLICEKGLPKGTLFPTPKEDETTLVYKGAHKIVKTSTIL